MPKKGFRIWPEDSSRHIRLPKVIRDLQKQIEALTWTLTREGNSAKREALNKEIGGCERQLKKLLTKHRTPDREDCGAREVSEPRGAVVFPDDDPGD